MVWIALATYFCVALYVWARGSLLGALLVLPAALWIVGYVMPLSWPAWAIWIAWVGSALLVSLAPWAVTDRFPRQQIIRQRY